MIKHHPLNSCFFYASLLDFVYAHQLAIDELQDNGVAKAIQDYVKKNASLLGWMLKEKQVGKDLKDLFVTHFPFIENVELIGKDQIPTPKDNCIIQ